MKQGDVRLGQLIEIGGKTWRVVRLVKEDSTLFQDGDKVFEITQSYAQLSGTQGEVDFIVFEGEVEYLHRGDEIKSIRGLNPKVWKKGTR